ncbi:serine/arginine-rich splicing factor 5-like isoform X2 [Stylophora pistillata]|uniref:serine/arginine-rich splicing factor 5-like isoform X2 n=1 Tax=Stylophora pistillata TaxID=50429 RepID=UPI000C046508|nr:serine/arginine-rich splicing factor 5-like isoform X2 [Stylophora pistillata]
MSRGGTRVYFGRLPRDTRERDLERFVRGFGRIREVSIKLGYGFVEFDDPRDADDCVYDLNGRELLGERVVVEHARNPSRSQDYGYRSQPSNRNNQRRGRTPPLRTEHRLAVENLSSRINWQDLKEYISKAGEVTFADAHKRRQGEGVVEFASKEDMKAALKKLDDTELHGKRIRLKIEKVRSSSRRSRSRSRSRSPKRRKSHSHSRSQSKSRSKSPKKRHNSSSHSRSPSKSRKSRSQSKEKERSRSKSVEEEEKKSPSPEKEEQEEEAEAEVEADGDEKEDSPEAVNGDEENGDAEQELEVEDEVEED